MDVINDVEKAKKAITEGEDPMKIGYKPTNLGNDFYYIKNPNTRIVVKIDPTTGNSDIVAFAIRSHTKNMRTFTAVVNSFDTKIKLNPNAY